MKITKTTSKRIAKVLGFLWVLALLLSVVSALFVLKPRAAELITPSFDPPFVNKYPVRDEVFSLIDPDGDNGFSFTRAELMGYASDYNFSAYLMLLDSDGNLMVTQSFKFDVYNSGSFVESISSTGAYIAFDPSDWRASSTFVLNYSGTPTQATYGCLIPLFVNSDVSSDEINSIISSYQSAYLSAYAYELGYNRGTSYGTQLNYQSGYSDGYERGFEEGSSDGTSRGYEYGYSDGYAEGYQEGSEVVSDYEDAVLYTVSAPFQAISNMLNFEVLGINLAGLFFFLLTAVILVFLIKTFVL